MQICNISTWQRAYKQDKEFLYKTIIRTIITAKALVKITDRIAEQVFHQRTLCVCVCVCVCVYVCVCIYIYISDSKHMKGSSTLLVIKEIQIKTFTFEQLKLKDWPPNLAKIMEQFFTLIHCWCECKMAESLLKTVWQFLLKKKKSIYSMIQLFYS